MYAPDVATTFCKILPSEYLFNKGASELALHERVGVDYADESAVSRELQHPLRERDAQRIQSHRRQIARSVIHALLVILLLPPVLLPSVTMRLSW